MLIDIIGAGSLGLLFAGKLAASGVRIRLWARSDAQVKELRSNGITVADSAGNSVCLSTGDLQVHAFDEWPNLGDRTPADWIFLMTKQGAVSNVLDILQREYRKQSQKASMKIVCFQNGLGHIQQIKEALPSAVIYQSITTEGARRAGKFSVIRSGEGVTEIGLFFDKKEEKINKVSGIFSNQEEVLLNRLVSAGFAARLSKEIGNRMYRKLIINAVINPLTALWRIPNGELLSSPGRLELMRRLYDEGTTIYDAHGIEWDPAWWNQILDVCQSTASNHSSMLADVESGRATEIAAINGHLVGLAEQVSLQAPMHSILWQLIAGMQPEEG